MRKSLEQIEDEDEGRGLFISRGCELQRGQQIIVRGQKHEVLRKAISRLSLGNLYQVVPIPS